MGDSEDGRCELVCRFIEVISRAIGSRCRQFLKGFANDLILVES